MNKHSVRQWIGAALLAAMTAFLGTSGTARAAVTIVASSTGGTNAAGNFNVAWPAGTTTNDVLIVAIASSQVSATATCTTNPTAVTAGFTLGANGRAATINIRCTRMTVYYKTITASDTSPSTFNTTYATGSAYVAVAARGVDIATVVDPVGSTSSATGASVTHSGVTTTADGSLPLEFYAVHSTGRTWTTPATTTPLSSLNTTGAVSVAGFVDGSAITPAGASGTRASSHGGLSSDRPIVAMMALKAGAVSSTPTDLSTTNNAAASYTVSAPATITMSMSNSGNNVAGGISWSAQLPAMFPNNASTTWTCAVTGTGSCGTASGTETDNVAVGAWTLNGFQAFVPYMPFGATISQILYVTNKSTQAGAVTVDAYNEAGTTCSFSAGTAAASAVTQLSTALVNGITACYGANYSGKVSFNVSAPIPGALAEVYSAYNVNGNRLTVINNSNGKTVTGGNTTLGNGL